MSTEDQIRMRLENHFTIRNLEIVNDSKKHAGHAGDNGSGESHFKIIMTADEFSGLSRVQCQRMVNTLLEDLFMQNLHALSLQLSAPDQGASLN